MIYLGAIMFSTFVAVAVCSVSILLFFEDIPASSEKFAILILGALVAAFGQVSQYWLGSSSTTARKDEAITNIASTATTSAANVANAAATTERNGA